MLGTLRTRGEPAPGAARGRAAPFRRPVELACLSILGLVILLYVIAYSSKSIAAFTTGRTLFDLATFEQGFWNATHGTLFFYSLEGEMSRFGRHFSPIFFALLPIYALRPAPSTLLVLQSLALGLAAVPLYLFARRRLASAPAALAIAALYLASPATHDLNIVNEFHEIAFAVPLLFVAFDAADRRCWGVYGAAVVGAIMVKEEIALTVAALGIFVLVARGRRVGLATIAGSLVWFVVVVEVVMRALRGPHGGVPFEGYEYLGPGVGGIALGVLTRSDELLRVLTDGPKREYVFWLLQPLAFLPLLAPEVLLIAAPALLEILASTYPYTFAIFERYVAPVLPFVFIGAVIGLSRLGSLARAVGAPRRAQSAAAVLVLLALGATTVYAARTLNKYPDRVLYPRDPEPHAAAAIQLARAVPERASVVVEDHRWLAQLAHRKQLYALGVSADTPTEPDYFLLDRKIPPITNGSKEQRAQTIARISASPDYLARCEDGVWLYISRQAHVRDGDVLPPYRWDHDVNQNFGGVIRLAGYTMDRAARPGGELAVTLFWQALREPIGADYTVFGHLTDGQERLVVQQDGRPQDGACLTEYWKRGQIVADPHLLRLGPDVGPGAYRLKVGLYTLADLKRLTLADPAGAPAGDGVTLPVSVLPRE